MREHTLLQHISLITYDFLMDIWIRKCVTCKGYNVAGYCHTEHTIHSWRDKHVGRLKSKSEQKKEKRGRQVIFVTNFHKNIKKKAKKTHKIVRIVWKIYIYAREVCLFNQTVTEEVNSKPKFCLPGNTAKLQGIHFNFVYYSREYSSILYNIPGNAVKFCLIFQGIQLNFV